MRHFIGILAYSKGSSITILRPSTDKGMTQPIPSYGRFDRRAGKHDTPNFI